MDVPVVVPVPAPDHVADVTISLVEPSALVGTAARPATLPRWSPRTAWTMNGAEADVRDRRRELDVVCFRRSLRAVTSVSGDIARSGSSGAAGVGQ